MRLASFSRPRTTKKLRRSKFLDRDFGTAEGELLLTVGNRRRIFGLRARGYAAGAGAGGGDDGRDHDDGGETGFDVRRKFPKNHSMWPESPNQTGRGILKPEEKESGLLCFVFI